jgi:hypothetical protein
MFLIISSSWKGLHGISRQMISISEKASANSGTKSPVRFDAWQSTVVLGAPEKWQIEEWGKVRYPSNKLFKSYKILESQPGSC